LAPVQAEQLLQHPPVPLRGQTSNVSCVNLTSAKLADQAVVQEASIQHGEEAANWCEATIVVPASPSHSQLKVWVALPLQNWNGRFLGIGGGGFLGGTPKGFIPTFDAAVSAGFVAASTDAGHSYIPGSEDVTGGDGSFALEPDGSLNSLAIRTFAHAGIHEMSVVAQDLAAKVYGIAPKYSYFAGCSTGGRQGQSEVQRYPEDYDGVVSGAPAINWTHFLPAALWAKVVMNEAHHVVSQCKLDAATQAAVSYCDKLDRVADGVLGRPDLCNFSARRLIGTKTPCGVVDATDARIIDQIWRGPRRLNGDWMWFGLPKGANFAFDIYDGKPTAIPISWIRYFVAQDPSWTADTLDRRKFEALFNRSVSEFGEVFDTSNSDLRAFYARGGKTIIWHGLADSNFPAEGTIKYVNDVRRKLGPARTDQFLRLYLAPDVEHCGGARGPVPVSLLDALIAWVEESKAPETISAQVRDGSGTVEAHWSLAPYRGDLAKTLAESHSLP
jgi:feruloyl esterase